MGYRLISLKLPTNYSDEELRLLVSRELRINEFSFTI